MFINQFMFTITEEYSSLVKIYVTTLNVDLKVMRCIFLLLFGKSLSFLVQNNHNADVDLILSRLSLFFMFFVFFFFLL